MLIGIDASRAVTNQRTGTEAYAYFLVRALMPLATYQGHRIRLYFNHPPPPNRFTATPEIEPVVMPFPRLWTHVRLAWELQRRPPDLFFTPSHVIPLSYRGRSVATIHDLGYHYFPEAHPGKQLAYLKWSTRHNSRVSRRLIADSQATKHDLVHLNGIDPAKIDVIYPGIDPDLQPVREQSQLEAVQNKYGISAPYLLYLGTLQPRKNLVRLIEAYVGGHLPHQLVLAGKVGWLSQPILDAVASHQSVVNDHSSSILLPGFIAESDKAALISGATALLFPSLYEGFGFPVLEAQACGTASLCANTSSLPELAEDAALLVDPLDTESLSAAIQRIATDARLRQGLISKGFENVKRFTWKEAAEQVLNTLEKAASPSLKEDS